MHDCNSVYADAPSRPFFVSPRVLYSVLIFASLSLLTIFAVRNGAYYDDEIFNVRAVESNDYLSLWRLMNSTDVHPPGSYLINKVLFNLLGSWEAAKIAAGLFNAFALALFGGLAFVHIGKTSRLALAILLMASSTFVLWGASVRWYAYFNPIFTIALGLVLFSSLNLTKRTAILAVTITLLFYISYATFCAAPVLIVAHLARARTTLTRLDLITLIFLGAVSLLICLPQFFTFLHVHLPGQGGQTGSLLNALGQTAITLSVGNTVFPIAAAPLLYTVLLASLGVRLFFLKRKPELDWIVLLALVTGVLAMTLTGIGTKPRNSVFLIPLVLFLAASSLEGLQPLLARGLLGLIALFQLLGAVNVIEHRGTLKGSYDTDYLSTMQTIERWKASCAGRFVVFHHDVVLGFLFEKTGVAQSSPFAKNQDKTLNLSPGDCVVFVKTFRGNFTPETLAPRYKIMETPNLRMTEIKLLSKDPNAKAKSWLMHEDFPQYLIELQRDEVLNPVSLPAWDFLCPGCQN